MFSGYRERAVPAGTEPWLACVWEQAPCEDRVQRILPDGCVDLIWVAERRLVAAGANTRPRCEPLPAGRCSTGVRIRPEAAGALLGVPASEVRDLLVDAGEFWSRAPSRLIEKLAVSGDTARVGCWSTRCWALGLLRIV